MNLNKGNSESRWTPFQAIDKADAYIKNLPMQAIKIDVETNTNVRFQDMMNTSNRELESYLSLFGGYRAYLEAELSELAAKKTALEAAFDEGFASASFSINDAREKQGHKKLTKEEVRGAVFNEYEGLKVLRRDVIEFEATYTRVLGLLNTYKAAYDTVSRVITLRTLARDGNFV